uniref:C-type lectin domain-containing protein n=1 Tax=Acrobeloides nanus TaxID=290746 RepID=A0A914DYE2_9BILA
MNIGPDHNGRVLPIFEERLRDIGAFVNAHSEAIFATKPWIYQNDSDSAVWYTSKLRSTTGFDPYRLYNPQQQNNTIIYAFVLDWPENNLVNLPHILPTAQTKVTLFGANGQNISLNYNQPLALNGGIQVDISSISLRRFPSTDAFVLRIEYAANQCPPNFVQSNSNKQNCLSLIDNKLDWTSANKDCAAKAATLISIGNSFENSEIQGLVKNCSQAYIGLNRTNNNWNWVDGDKSAYTNWKTGNFYI